MRNFLPAEYNEVTSRNYNIHATCMLEKKIYISILYLIIIIFYFNYISINTL